MTQSRLPPIHSLIGHCDILMITLDTLRFDVADAALRAGRTPFLRQILPDGRWEQRHTPGSFTYAAHHAFFAGFLPTPATPGPHARLFAAEFPGSETTSSDTFVFQEPDLVTALAHRAYRTICIGGVGFFNQRSALGRVLPNLFHEAYWTEQLGVTCRESTQYQVSAAISAIDGRPTAERVFLFLNVSALHQPNCMYVEGAHHDSPQTQSAALSYVDSKLSRLFHHLQLRAPLLCIICSDHGTAYGEDGFTGHRLSHPVVWTVPYAEMLLPKTG
ncbi:MAG: STM4013/SEN3800 family hydrolase [Planctomycetaceae bacterium]